jgi:AraC family transcriptional regulator
MQRPVAKALWYIESHFGDDPPITLDDVASAACVSRFHLSRAFATAFGYTVMRYVRGRRLTEAARMLAAGAPDILALALQAGYGSHEAFTRAFREEFRLTPEEVRERRGLERLTLMEPIRMNHKTTLELPPPRFEDGKELLLAGISERYTSAATAGIPAQWMRFAPHIGNVPGQVGFTTYGAVSDCDEPGNCDYLSGVEVASAANIGSELTTLRIPARRYAVFSYHGHISAIQQVWQSIWSNWMPESGYEATGDPALERYPETFDPRTGNGGFEIWIPVATRKKIDNTN